jgi:hypothetical protein
VLFGLILVINSFVTIHNTGYAHNQRDNASNDPSQETSNQPSPTSEDTSDSKTTVVQQSEGIKVNGKDRYNNLKRIDWGEVHINRASTYEIVVTNVGYQPVVLELSASNWSPDVNGEVSWDYNGSSIPVKGEISITLSLTIKDAKTDTFNVDITIFSSNT